MHKFLKLILLSTVMLPCALAMELVQTNQYNSHVNMMQLNKQWKVPVWPSYDNMDIDDSRLSLDIDQSLNETTESIKCFNDQVE